MTLSRMHVCVSFLAQYETDIRQRRRREREIFADFMAVREKSAHSHAATAKVSHKMHKEDSDFKVLENHALAIA